MELTTLVLALVLFRFSFKEINATSAIWVIQELFFSEIPKNKSLLLNFLMIINLSDQTKGKEFKDQEEKYID